MAFSPPTAADIDKVVDLIVSSTSPLRIVLFGSAARGELQANSDLDIMVVVPNGSDTLRVAQGLHVAMLDIPQVARRVSVDFIVTTPDRYEARKDSLGSVYRDVARDGRELYAA